MTVDEFRNAMAPLGANPWKYGKGLTKPTMRLFWAVFADRDAVAFATAIRRHVETSSEFPTVADIGTLLNPQEAPSLAEAGLVFEALLGKAPNYDPRLGDWWTTENVFERFGQFALGAFMAAGGARAFRDRTEAGIPFLRRDFFRGWTEAVERYRVEGPRALVPASATPRGLAPIADSVPRLLPSGEEAGDAYEETTDAEK